MDGGICIFGDVDLRIKKRNKILFARNSECLQELRRLISEQKHITLILWVFECLQIPMNEMISKYPDKMEIKMANDLSNGWAHGKVKMTIAKRAILNCHSLSRELEYEQDIALCHAIGQGCSTVHVETHALGMVFYELTAIVIKHKYKDYQVEVLDKIKFYINKLLWYQEHADDLVKNQVWTEFLIRENSSNKEKLLLEKEKNPTEPKEKSSDNSQESEVDSLIPNKKIERLLMLYYKIFLESEDFGLYDEWRTPYFAYDLRISDCTARRYINELIKTGRVIMEEDGENWYYLKNIKFTSFEEIDDYMKSQELKWMEKGNFTAESRRLLRLIRLIGWIDLFLQYGKISESEINQFYTNKSEKRKIWRDFALLRGLNDVNLDVKRVQILSKEDEGKQWFYTINEKSIGERKDK